MEAYRDQYARIFRGGRDIVLIAISTDDARELASWAKDLDAPFLFGSDEGSEVGKKYGAWRSLPGGGAIDNRSLFVVDGEGVIRYVAAPFREVDPSAYDELAEAVDRIAGPAGD
jgi:peroxiredoxin Q/BCP